MTNSELRNSIHGSFQQCGLLIVSLLLTCFVLPPMMQAQGPDTEGAIAGFNNGEGIGVLLGRTTGVSNTGTGYQALHRLTVGNQNTATGFRALLSDTSGNFNTATGANSLANNTTGTWNTATGSDALYNNTTGNVNTANGLRALFRNTTGDANTANGFTALINNTIGAANTATGSDALFDNTAGDFNTANGYEALFSNTTGNSNTALGASAGFNITGSGNVCIGQGVLGVAGQNNTTRIRNVYPSFASARAVYVNSDNKIGTLVSSRRFKNEIKPMDKASETILALKPVTFRYKKEIEPNGTIMFGLIAEEVEKIAPELVTRNDKGEVETVRYDAVNAMLLNEFLKEHRKNEQQQATIAQLKSTVAKQEVTIARLQTGLETVTARLNAQTTQIQKVSAQLEVSRPAPKTVLNNQ